MKTASIKSRLEKAGYSVRNDGWKYSVVANGKELSWYDQGGSTSAIHIRSLTDISRPEVDYFAGWFAHTIKSALRGLAGLY